MTYQDIHTFLTIASSSSLSKAAESLFVSQPALSHRLSALEEELGTELVIRRKGSRTLELTDAGQRFIPIARKWEQLWIETGKIKFEQPSTQLRIVNVDSLNFYFMPQVIEDFLKENPKCSLHINTMQSNLSYKTIENKEADLGLITNPHFFKKVQTIPLFEEQLVFVCHQDACYQDGLLPSQLDSSNEIYIPWSNTFLMWHDYWFGNDPEVKVMLDNMALLRQLLDLKDAWAIMPATLGRKLAEKENCRIVSLENGPEYRTCYAIMNDQRNAHPLVTEFLQKLLTTVSSIPEIRLLDPQFHQHP
ncbi:LysR family transcriptional regulator [Blautia sp. MSJ-19]|uniref:LysR family transcriptional regulator n=1 Tax=Blautia sp. MSJ-19 TaxID=2841517 RepID=UPI001C0E95EA|nr:LysR family transcriptional regulator [Blautia sp. MSJ-19]MBU5481879.1 LysR family transcriptional regulator [Blautia sp. MSJ-19]